MAGVVTQGRQSLPEETRGDYGVAHVPNLLWRGKETELTDNWMGKQCKCECETALLTSQYQTLFLVFDFLLFVLLPTMQCAMAQGQQAGGTHSGVTYLDRPRNIICLPILGGNWWTIFGENIRRSKEDPRQNKAEQGRGNQRWLWGCRQPDKVYFSAFLGLSEKKKVETLNFTSRVGYICIQPIGNLGIHNALNVVEMQSQAAWYTFKKRERQSSKNLVKIWAILNGDARQGKARRGNQRWLWGHLAWLSTSCTTFKTPPKHKDAKNMKSSLKVHK